MVSGPHDARMLDSGNILVFDNGLSRKRSRVLELDPVMREVVWEHTGDDPFFTIFRGSCQRLPNGNTLIANSDHGEAFEVTPDGRQVWRFLNPQLTAEGKRRLIVRMIRYPPEWIDPLLEGSARAPRTPERRQDAS